MPPTCAGAPCALQGALPGSEAHPAARGAAPASELHSPLGQIAESLSLQCPHLQNGPGEVTSFPGSHESKCRAGNNVSNLQSWGAGPRHRNAAERQTSRLKSVDIRYSSPWLFRWGH